MVSVGGDVLEPNELLGREIRVVRGNSLPAWLDTGAGHHIDGRRDKMNVAQSGTWAAPATGGTFTVTSSSSTDPRPAALTEWMVGWVRAANVPERSTASHGKAARHQPGRLPARARGQPAGGHADCGGRLRQSRGCGPGRRLQGRPLAGVYVYASDNVYYRQQGNNFCGQYYTLHRHYDPNLMRFTSPDPIASPWWNLHGYAGNNPAGAFDPDGLARKKKWSGDTFTKDLIDSGLDVLEGMVTKSYGGGAATVASGFQMAEGAQFGDTFVGRGLSDIHQRRDAWLVNYGEDGVAARLYATGGVVGDMIGITGLREGVSGRDAVTGESLGRHERYERAVDGASSLLLTAGMAAAPRVAPWASGIGSGARVGGTVTLPMFRRMTPELAPGPHRAQIQYLKAMRYTKHPGTNELGAVTSRGSWRKATLQAAWENAKPGPTGGRLCPTCGCEVKVPPFGGRMRDWDVNHSPPWTKRLFDDYAARRGVLENYQLGTWLECPHCNRAAGNRRK